MFAIKNKKSIFLFSLNSLQIQLTKSVEYLFCIVYIILIRTKVCQLLYPSKLPKNSHKSEFRFRSNWFLLFKIIISVLSYLLLYFESIF